MRTTLLSLAVFGFAAVANAQLLNYGFESGDVMPGALETVNWENYAEGSSWTFEDTDAFEGQFALGVVTDKTCNPWERVVAFKNLAVEPMKSYRVSFMAKGTAPVNVGILEGDWYQDIALQTPNGAQTYDKALTGDWQRVSQVFWSPSYEDMCSKYSNADHPELLKEYFLRLAFTGIGSFKIDNIKIEESSIAGVVYNGDALCVDFGYATNAAELAAAAGGTAVLDNSCVTVLVNGEPTEVASVEVKKDGLFCIFINDWLDESSSVAVSFSNGVGLKYANSVAPMCFEEANAAVFAFEAEAAYYDPEFSASPVAWEEAVLVSSTPEDGSFELDNDLSTFTFTFNKPVLTSWEGDPAVATLAGQGVNEQLVIVESEEANPTLTFNRPAGSAPLAKGQYTITIENVCNEMGVPTGVAGIITIEVGKVTVAETTYTLVAECTFPEAPANGIPEGWTVLSDGEVRTSEGSYGAGGRVFDCGAPQHKGIYTRANGGEGSVTGPLVAIPAGEIEFRALIAGWSSNSNVTLQLLNANDEVVFEDTFNTEAAAEGTRNNGDFKFPAKTYRFKHDGSELKMYVKLNSEGFSGMFVGGFEVYTYTETEGEKDQSEVICNGSFSDVQGNYIPAAGSGWRIHRGAVVRDPGANGGWGGNDTAGGQGGPRMFDLAYKFMGGKGVYLDGGDHNWLTYGEFLTYEVVLEDGSVEVKDETIFTLPAAKLQFTYYAALWKAEGVKINMDIIRQEDGVDGTPIYTQSDVIKTVSPQGNQNDGNIEAMKVQFFWNCPEAGNYMLKFYTDGEGFVGNIKVETTASMAVQYKNLLKEALKLAQEELETANSDDNYRGATRDALAKAIEDYTNPDFHTAGEYNAAIAHLEQLVKAMSARRANINNFAAGVTALREGLEAAEGTKFENMDEYDYVKSYYDTYAEADPVALDDAELADAVAVMKSAGNLLKNMVEVCVPFLTQQAVDLAGMIVALDAEAESHPQVLAAFDALTDDQELVAVLKKFYTGKLYAKLAVENPFEYEEEDPDLGITFTVTDSIDVSAMIQNRGFYTTAQKQNTGALANEQSFPGWDIVINQNSILADWGWGGPYNCSPERPISDAAVCTAWGTSNIVVSQNIALLPVGTYTAIIKVGDGTSTNEENLSRAFVKTDAMEEAVEAVVINDNGARNAQPYTFTLVTPDVAENTASFTLGAKLMSRGDFSKCDDAAIYLTGKAEGFDYAAASAALLQEVAEGIQLQERDDQPAISLFYDLNGRRIQVADGVCIRIDRYADGYTVVRKVVVK